MNNLEMTVPAYSSALAGIDETIMKHLKAWHITKARAFHFAMHEAVINAIQARERLDVVEDDSMVIRLSYEGDTLMGVVEDTFGGRKDNVEAENHRLWCESGRGMMLMSHLVDELSYENNDEGGFTICLIMHDSEKETL